MTQVVKRHSRARATACSLTTLCRSWRQTHLKAAYDISMIGDDDEAVALIVAIADASMAELEREIIDAPMATMDEAQAVLSIALAILREEPLSDRPERLIRTAHKGLNAVRNETGRRAAA